MCENLNSSILGGSVSKYIKVYKEEFVVVDGAYFRNRFDLSNLKIPYEQYFVTEILLDVQTFDTPLYYGALGQQITFLALRVTYEPTVKKLIPDPEIPCLQYMFSTNENEVRYINNLLTLTGTNDHKLPQIFLSNPNTANRARIQILAATTDVTFEPATVVSQVNASTINIQNLVFTNIVSDNSGLSIIVQTDPNTPLANIALNRISNIEVNGRILIIDDTAVGKINLFFIDDYNCLQAYSLINWALKNPTVNKITTSTGPDNTPPVITYANTFTTEISLLNYPDGTSGNYLITIDDLITLEIDNVTDNRDGVIIVDDSDITLTKINQNLQRQAISEIGKYSFTIDVKDSAGNDTTNTFILTVTDMQPPKVILTNLGYQLYLDSTSGTAGFTSQPSIYLQDYSLNVINKQDLIDLFIAQVTDEIDGTILKNTNNIEVTITPYQNVNILPDMSTAGFYDVYFQVADSLNNVSISLWKDINTELRDLSNNKFTNLSVEIKTNQAPVVNFFNPIPNLHLNSYSNFIDKSVLKSVLIDNVTDDRDGIITTNILNISVFKDYMFGTSGTAGSTSGIITVIDGTNSFEFEIIPEFEVISIVTEGIYRMQVLVVDSDGLIDIQSADVNILT